MKSLLLSMLLVFSVCSHAEEAKGAAAQAVNAACAQDGATAGCGNEKVGTGLLKCIKAYKKEHKDFKVSEGCRASMKGLKEAAKARKAAK